MEIAKPVEIPIPTPEPEPVIEAKEESTGGLKVMGKIDLNMAKTERKV